MGEVVFNRELFDSMAAYVDVVWKIDILKDTVYVMHDKFTPTLLKRELSMEEVTSFIEESCHPKYRDKALYTINRENLLNLKESSVVEIKTLVNYTYQLIRCSFTPVVNENGQTTVVFLTMHKVEDMPDSKSDSYIRDELDRYMTAVSCGILQYTRDTRKLVYANDMALSILGYSSMEEMIEDGFDGVVKTVNVEDAEKIKALINNIKGEENVVECEYRVKHKDGKDLYCMGKIRLIDRGGQEPLIQRSMIDITSMRMASNLYRQVADTLAVADIGMWYFILDDGVPRFYVDDVVARLIGASVNSTPEENYSVWYNTLSSETKVKVNEAVLKMRNGQPAEVTYQYKHPTRGNIIVRCGGHKDNSYQGSGVMIRGYHQDITKYNKKLIEQLEIVDAVGKIYSAVCHINLDKGTSRFIDKSEAEQGAKDRPIDSIRTKLLNDVSDESRQELIRLFDSDYLKQILKEKEHFSTTIKLTIKTVVLTFVVTGYNDDGQVEKCILFVEG